jgi:hypothetical protein
MRPVDQTLFGEGRGNCHAACAATILELRLDVVPNFCANYPDSWYSVFAKWLHLRGLAPLTQEFPGDQEPFMAWASKCAPNIPWIAGGPTDRGMHCVVYIGTHMFHDPNPNHGRKGLDAVDSATYLLSSFSTQF